jgi:hypothetical protein
MAVENISWQRECVELAAVQSLLPQVVSLIDFLTLHNLLAPPSFPLLVLNGKVVLTILMRDGDVGALVHSSLKRNLPPGMICTKDLGGTVEVLISRVPLENLDSGTYVTQDVALEEEGGETSRGAAEHLQSLDSVDLLLQVLLGQQRMCCGRAQRHCKLLRSAEPKCRVQLLPSRKLPP